MLESAIDNLAFGEGGCDFNIFTVYPKDDSEFPGTPGVRLFNGTPRNLVLKIIPLCVLHRFLSFFRIRLSGPGADMKGLFSSDAVLIIGGTTFSDEQPLKIAYNVACLRPAVLLRKRSMMYSQTLGPFRKWYNRLAGKMLLPRISVVVARGRGSLENVRGIGLDSAVTFTDSAFTLHVPEEMEEGIRAHYAPILEGKTVVGISVNSIVERKCRKRGIDHNGSFASLIEYLRNKGYFILLIPHSMRQRSKLRHNNDLFTVADILGLLDSTDGIHVVREPYDSKELRVVVGLSDYYIASRFHSMISALCTGVPVAVFGWGAQKYWEVLEEFDLQDYYNDCREISGENLVKGFEQAVRDSEAIREKMRANIARVTASSAAMHRVAGRLCRNENPLDENPLDEDPLEQDPLIDEQQHG